MKVKELIYILGYGKLMNERVVYIKEADWDIIKDRRILVRKIK